MKSPLTYRCGSIALALGAAVIAASAWAADPPKIDLSGGDVERGKALAMSSAKGNCIACHMIIGGESPGSLGPALIAMQARYPSKEDLAIRIWDATVKTPDAAMPPFGRNEILNKQEFADVVAYIWSL